MLFFLLQFSTVSTPTTPSCGSLQKSIMAMDVVWRKLLGYAFDIQATECLGPYQVEAETQQSWTELITSNTSDLHEIVLPNVTVQRKKKVQRTQTYGISDLQEKMLPHFRPEPPVHIESEWTTMAHASRYCFACALADRSWGWGMFSLELSRVPTVCVN